MSTSTSMIGIAALALAGSVLFGGTASAATINPAPTTCYGWTIVNGHIQPSTTSGCTSSNTGTNGSSSSSSGGNGTSTQGTVTNNCNTGCTGSAKGTGGKG